MKIKHTPRILVGIFAVIAVSTLLACFAFSSSASALQTVPYKMNFQGRLTDASGNAMANGTYNMKFRIYDALTGGALQWNEQRANFTSTGVTVTNGLFSVQLGDVSSLPVAIFTNQNLYFEIELPTPATATCSTSACESYTEGPMGPRNKLGTSAYAFNSDTLDGIDSTGFIQNSTTFQQGNIAVQNAAAGNIGIAIKGTASQTGDLLQTQNSSGVYMSGIDKFGRFMFGTNVSLQGAGISLQTTDVAQQGMVVRGLVGQTSELFDVQSSTGTNLLSVGGSGGLSIATPTDMVGALAVRNSAGFSLANVDTSSSGVSFGRTTSTAGATFGRTTVGGSTDANDYLGINATRFQTGATAGPTGSISVNIGGSVSSSPNNKFKLAVYADNAGSPGALVAQTAEGTLVSGWNTLVLSATLSNNTYYWLGYATNGSLNNMTFDNTGSGYFVNNTYASGFPGALTGGSTSPQNFSMYVTFSSGYISALSIDGTGRVGIGNAAPTHKLDVAGDAVFANTLNSSAAFLVQNAAGLDLLTVDTSSSVIHVGSSTANNNPVLFAMNNYNTATDPTGFVGAMYYNSNLGKFRCYQGAAWTDCIGAGSGSTLQTDYAASTGGTTPSVKIDSTRGGVSVQDADTTINGTLFSVNGSNGAGLGSNLLSVSSNGQVKMGSLGTATGQVYVSGTLPTQVSSTSSSSAVGFAMSGRYGFVTQNGPNFLQALDFSNPASPVALSTVSITAPTALVVSGNYAYVANGNNLTVVDISNPSSMVIKGTYLGGTPISTMAVQGKYVYAINKAFSQVNMVDVSNPATPVSAGTFAVIANADSIETQGEYVFIGSRTGGVIQAYDASTTTPTAVGSSVALTGVSSLSAQGRYLYAVSSTSTSAKVFDISNPASVTSPSSFTLAANAIGVIASGQYLYVPETNKFEVFDISTPSTATSIGSTTVSTFTVGSTYTDQSIYMNGRYSYVVERSGGSIRTFDVGGVYTPAIQSGSLEASHVSVNQSIGIGQNASIAGSLNVGAGASIFGDVAMTGTAQFKSFTNSATAFRLQNATNGNIFVADTTNSRIYIGDPTPDATAVVLVVDNASGTADPTGVNGAMYYNTTIGKFRCYEFNVWKNCTGSTSSASASVAGQSLTAGAANYLSGSSFGVPSTAGLQFGQTVTWRVMLSKTAAGTAASSFIVYTGTNGTAADTARCTMSTGTATAAIDNAVAVVTAYVSNAGATAVLQCGVQILHGNASAAAGFIITPMVTTTAASSSFDSTPASTKIGLGLTTGAASVITVNSVYTSSTNF